MLSAVVGVARPTDLDAENGTLTIAFPPGSAFNRRKADDKDNKVVVAEAISTVVGTPLRPAFTMLDAEPEVETAPGRCAVRCRPYRRRLIRMSSSSASSANSTRKCWSTTDRQPMEETS